MTSYTIQTIAIDSSQFLNFGAECRWNNREIGQTYHFRFDPHTPASILHFDELRRQTLLVLRDHFSVLEVS